MNEDLNNHLMDLEEIMNTFQYNGVSQDAVYLRAFSFTLKDDAKHWLRSLPNRSIRTWDEMTRKFLDKYFSSVKTGKFIREIHNFCQNKTETVFEAWERFKKITPEEIVSILDELSEDANQWPSKIAERRRANGVHQVDANISMQVQLDAMAKEIRKPTLASIQTPRFFMEFIWGYANAWKRNNSRFQVAPGFGNQPRPQFQPPQSIQSGLEDLMKSFIVKIDERLDAHGAAIKELGTGLRNLERQVGQIAIILSKRIPGTLPADTKKNPKETVNIVTLRSGQVLKDPTPIHKEVAPEKESGKELKIEDDKNTEKKKGKKGAEKKKKEENSRRDESEESKQMPALPFPQKLYREKHDKQFERFLDMLKQVNLNFPFNEVLSQMPAYAKLLKEILTKKRKIEETLVVKLTEHCSAILKLENELGEIRSTPISLKLEDQTTIIPEGIEEDVLVRVYKFVFPIDLIVVNMEDNKEVPLILGRLFLATGIAILDIHDRKLMLRVGEETVTFEMNVATGVKKEKPAASVEWRVKSANEKVLVIERDKFGVYPKKAEKKLSAWMCALVRPRGMEPDFDSDPD
ncbi:uncharacterized protein [Nicotiana tomentosiformis]|uniref:uncharacterized protein n=1 Tax=Nicotiana tomentosiformis TaxID=4098 RepID=UPI00388CC0E2